MMSLFTNHMSVMWKQINLNTIFRNSGSRTKLLVTGVLLCVFVCGSGCSEEQQVALCTSEDESAGRELSSDCIRAVKGDEKIVDVSYHLGSIAAQDDMDVRARIVFNKRIPLSALDEILSDLAVECIGADFKDPDGPLYSAYYFDKPIACTNLLTPLQSELSRRIEDGTFLYRKSKTALDSGQLSIGIMIVQGKASKLLQYWRDHSELVRIVAFPPKFTPDSPIGVSNLIPE